MSVRKATLEDVPAILEMGVSMTKESSVLSKFTPNYRKQYQVITRAIENPQCCVLICEDGHGMFIGHVDEEVWYDNIYAQEDLLFVPEQHRRSRRAKDLIDGFEKWVGTIKAAGVPVREIRFGTSINVNPELVVKFYEKRGAVRIPSFRLVKEI